MKENIFFLQSVRLKLKWFWLILFVLIPFISLPFLFRTLETVALIENHDISSSITFFYDADRTIKTYNNSPTGIRYVFMPSFADMSEIGVKTSVDKVVFSAGTKQTTITRNITSVCSFDTDVEYHVSFYDTFDRKIAEDTIVFLKSDKLPTLYITSETGTMENLNADKTYSEGGTYELLDSVGNVLYADTLPSISARGNQTFLYEKKSYQIDTHTPVNLLNMGESDTWILLSNVYDPSYIRNKLTYDMALHADMEGSPKSEYVDVYFNGEYGGMYLICEKVEFAPNRLPYEDLEAKNLAVNNGNLSKMHSYISENPSQKALLLPDNPFDITGGYLIEHDYGYKFDEIVSGFTTNMGEQFALKNPKHASKEEIQYISRLMQEIEDAIISPDGINPYTGKHFTEYIDMNSWADKYLVEEICRNNGGGTTSSYFYKPSDSVSKKVFGGPVWDYDKAYGNYHGYNKNTRDLAFLTLHEFYGNWFYYLYQHEPFLNKVKENYAEKFSSYLEQMSTQKIDECTSYIEASAKLDNARFSHVYQEFGDEAQNYRALTEDIRKFILERKEFLDQVWIEDKPLCFLHFRYEGENGNRTVGIIPGESLQDFPTIYVEGKELDHWEIEGMGIPFTLDTPVTEEMTLIPIWKENE